MISNLIRNTYLKIVPIAPMIVKVLSVKVKATEGHPAKSATEIHWTAVTKSSNLSSNIL